MREKNYTSIEPLDRIGMAVLLILSLLIGIVILQGDVVSANVRNFSWKNQIIGADDTSFMMTFSRPMDKKSVEDNLKIEPPLAGKTSWSGRRFFYTLLTPAPYGTNYKVSLEGAKDKFAAKEGKNRPIQPFTGNFSTRDRVIVYIGVEGEEQGRLILYNLNKQQKKVITPKNYIVLDFQAYPNGDRILYSARTADNPDITSAQIYSVTTGITNNNTKEPEREGKVETLVDSRDYQNLKFDLSPDGQTIVVQRANKKQVGEYGLWFLPAKTDNGKPPTPQAIQSAPGGDFLITPDSQAVAVTQGQGTAIIPLQKDGTKPLDFLPQFALVQTFSKDGSQAAMVKYNQDFTKALFLVSNQGEQKEILRGKGDIISCQFDTASPTLYCLLTQLIGNGEYAQEQPYFVAFDLKTGKQKPLIVLPNNQRNVQLSLAPDGLGLLFDQVQSQSQTNPNQPPQQTVLTTIDGLPVVSSSLWFMPLDPISGLGNDMKPEQLPLPGFHPRWLP